MKEIELLEMELKLIADNIKRLKAYQEAQKKYGATFNSLVVGEFKHRLIALKQRLTIIVQTVNTYELTRKP